MIIAKIAIWAGALLLCFTLLMMWRNNFTLKTRLRVINSLPYPQWRSVLDRYTYYQVMWDLRKWRATDFYPELKTYE